MMKKQFAMLLAVLMMLCGAFAQAEGIAAPPAETAVPVSAAKNASGR